MRYWLIFLLTTLLFANFSEEAFAKACVDWPRVFATSETEEIGEKLLVQMDSFKNDSLNKGDDWLQLGIPYLLSRFINIQPRIKAILQQDLQRSKQPKPFAFRVEGLFQHQKGWLRVFVQLKNPQGIVIASHPIQTPYPLHQHFFGGLREAALTLLQKMKMEGQMDLLKKVERETNNVAAFQNYIRGLDALRTYDPNQMEVALVWFQESRREDNQYIRAYEGMIAAHGFLSLFHKANGEGFQSDVEQMEQILREWKQKEELNKRFIEGAIHYAIGFKAFSEGKTSKAVTILRQALEQTPEDPMAHYYLALSYDKMGKQKEAAMHRQKALEINPCLN